ncbi:putative Pollen Ole e 1 allergen and extensin family protein [Tripterygium wilfordii]|uniref:Putative Pollen Ole e 1 allergen and extensin family protein n=2 Tax=Tripterygium wilfordii TaxID=458696 RepID=A0A7J7DFP5_TRIWF|nr:putative Pollen Ole e 1 allergen and extensin family protein [Tripterygium wilfordii]
MAIRMLNLAALLLVLISSRIQLSACQALKGKVSCLDCKNHYDFSGIKILVKCDKVKKLSMANTKEDGSFAVDLPSESTKTPLNCLAKLVGGPSALYASKKGVVSQIVRADGENSGFYAISTPLAFSTKCPSKVMKCGVGSSKTVDLPLPPEWGLAPSSYYIPFVPIIGIP